jgi:hypothetical protein
MAAHRKPQLTSHPRAVPLVLRRRNGSLSADRTVSADTGAASRIEGLEMRVPVAVVLRDGDVTPAPLTFGDTPPPPAHSHALSRSLVTGARSRDRSVTRARPLISARGKMPVGSGVPRSDELTLDGGSPANPSTPVQFGAPPLDICWCLPSFRPRRGPSPYASALRRAALTRGLAHSRDLAVP